MRIAVFAAVALLGGNAAAASDCDQLKAVGPELAPRQIGYLTSAGPQVMQENLQYPDGIGPVAWRCNYRVGNAQISLIIATRPSDPMPCKRKVAFE